MAGQVIGHTHEGRRHSRSSCGHNTPSLKPLDEVFHRTTQQISADITAVVKMSTRMHLCVLLHRFLRYLAS